MSRVSAESVAACIIAVHQYLKKLQRYCTPLYFVVGQMEL